MGVVFGPEKIPEIGKRVNNRNPLENIENYNDEMTISQVIRFFERQGFIFTKSMIQNYVRNGLIPPPENKRYYTRIHLFLLAMIDGLKDVYSIDEMKAVLAPLISSDSGLGDPEIYPYLMEAYRSSVAEWIDSVPELVNKAEKAMAELKTEDGVDAVRSVATLLMMMAQSAAIKKAIGLVIEEINPLTN